MATEIVAAEYTVTVQGAGLDDGDETFTPVGSAVTLSVDNFYFDPQLTTVRVDSTQKGVEKNRFTKQTFELHFDVPFMSDIHGSGKLAAILRANAKVIVVFTAGGGAWTVKGLRQNMPHNMSEPPKFGTVNVLPYGVAPVFA